jgi:integrase
VVENCVEQGFPAPALVSSVVSLQVFHDCSGAHTTEHCIRIHIRHLKRLLGERTLFRSIDLTAVQAYVDSRSKAPGLNGNRLSATTIKKEIAPLNMIGSWAQNHEFIDRPLPKRACGIRRPRTSRHFRPAQKSSGRLPRAAFLQDDEADLWDPAFLMLPEIEKMLKCVRKRAGHRLLYPAFVFAAHTRARRSEIRRSRIEDLDCEGIRLSLVRIWSGFLP